MNLSDWLDYLAFSPALFLPCSALCLGIGAFICSKPHTKEGDTMKPKERTLDWIDVLTAYPLFIPLWMCAFVYLFMCRIELADFGGVMFLLLLLVLWFRALLDSSTRLFEYYTIQEPEPLSLNPDPRPLTSAN